MLKKKYRLSSFNLKGAKNSHSPLFGLKFANNNLGFSRFGFVISKKVDKRAVVRNSLKRKLSRCIEEIFDRIENGNDFIFFLKPESASVTQKELMEEVKNVFLKEKFLK